MSEYSKEKLDILCKTVIAAFDKEWCFEYPQCNDIRILHIPDYIKDLEDKYIEIETDNMFGCDITSNSLLVVPQNISAHLLYYANYYYNTDSFVINDAEPVFLFHQLLDRLIIQSLSKEDYTRRIKSYGGLLLSSMHAGTVFYRDHFEIDKNVLNEKLDRLLNRLFIPGSEPRYLRYTFEIYEESKEYNRNELFKEYTDNREKYWDAMVINK